MKMTCAECGKEFLLHALVDGVCILCRGDEIESAQYEESQRTNAQNAGGSSASAIRLASITLNISTFIGALGVMALFIIGIRSNEFTSFTLITTSIFAAFILAVSWAMVRITIGMAQDLRSIRSTIEDSKK